MDYVCEISHQSAQPSVSIRTRKAVQDLPTEIQRCFGTLAGYLSSNNQCPVEPVYAAYYNMDMSDLDVEIGFGLVAPVPGRGEIAATWLPDADIASTLHVGAYDGIGAGYETLMAFMQQNGRVGTGVAYEYYLNDPSTGEAPRTRIVFPLQPAA
jgi:effector-binding domain-containing protein